MTVRILVGDCRQRLAELGDDSIDSCVCDPPYELGFMNKKWDSSGVAFDPATWSAVLRVVKPGAYLLAFGGTRTFHRMTCAIEDAGFEIHDCLSWLYGSGFPKHKSKLKPAWEPVIVARRPAAKATPLQIDACRIPFADAADAAESKTKNRHADFGTEPGGNKVYGDFSMVERQNYDPDARWPANVLLDEEAAAILDAQSGESVSTGGSRGAGGQHGVYSPIGAQPDIMPGYGDRGGASRFFYVAKASRAEREIGLYDDEQKPAGTMEDDPYEWPDGRNTRRANHHPTVKPVDLMRWLCRLVTPKGGVILDPFLRSGTTAIAAVAEGFDAIGCELNPEYADLAERRISGDNPLFANVVRS